MKCVQTKLYRDNIDYLVLYLSGTIWYLAYFGFMYFIGINQLQEATFKHYIVTASGGFALSYVYNCCLTIITVIGEADWLSDKLSKSSFTLDDLENPFWYFMWAHVLSAIIPAVYFLTKYLTFIHSHVIIMV